MIMHGLTNFKFILGSYFVIISIYEMGCKMEAVKLAAELQRSS